jgi:hypothetical protein
MLQRDWKTVDDFVSTRWKAYLEEYVFIGLIVLSVLGVFLSDFSEILSFWYWLMMIPFFGLTAVLSAWAHAKMHDPSLLPNMVLTQVVHWGGTFIALLTTYSLWHTGRFTNENTGFIILILLALTTFLAGLHVGWRFYVAGVFLFLGCILATYVRQAFGIVILGLIVPLAILGIMWERFRSKEKPLERPEGQ